MKVDGVGWEALLAVLSCVLCALALLAPHHHHVMFHDHHVPVHRQISAISKVMCRIFSFSTFELIVCDVLYEVYLAIIVLKTSLSVGFLQRSKYCTYSVVVGRIEQSERHVRRLIGYVAFWFCLRTYYKKYCT